MRVDSGRTRGGARVGLGAWKGGAGSQNLHGCALPAPTPRPAPAPPLPTYPAPPFAHTPSSLSSPCPTHTAGVDPFPPVLYGTHTHSLTLTHTTTTTTTTLRPQPGEGLLVGSFARCLALVHSECDETSYIASRPFRVNAGPVGGVRFAFMIS